MESIGNDISPPAQSSPCRHTAGAGGQRLGDPLGCEREEMMRPARAEGEAACKQVRRLTPGQSIRRRDLTEPLLSF